MDDVGRAFRKWIVGRRVMGAAPRACNDDCIRIELDGTTAEVNFYESDLPCEIVELVIRRLGDDNPTFFLHFLLEDLDRACDLFEEMVEALSDDMCGQSTKVLLCCSSGMTTSFFATKMQEAARGLGLDYEFEATSFERALQTDERYAAILLAPQVGHRRGEMVAAHARSAVFEIPGRIFGSYDAVSALRLLMHALREVHVPGDDTGNLRAMRDLSNDRRILVVTLFALMRTSRLGYRLYDHGSIVLEGTVRKTRLDYRDVEDLLETLSVEGVDLGEIDAIGIAVPGVAWRGSVSLPGLLDVTYDLGTRIAERFGVPVHVDNNCNAAAVGCYVSQEKYESLVFYRHEFGHIAGGFGTVIDGRLLKGRHSLAGEPKYFERQFEYVTGYYDACWSTEGLAEIVKNVLVCSIALVAPEAVYVAAGSLDDMDTLHDMLARVFPEELIPPLFAVSDYVERVYLGEMALCLQDLSNPGHRAHGEA